MVKQCAWDICKSDTQYPERTINRVHVNTISQTETKHRYPLDKAVWETIVNLT